MGLFTKKIGPVFYKEGNSAEEYIKKLEVLKAEAAGTVKKEIETQLAMAKYGMAGEKNIAFELKNSGMDMYILHDIYLEHADLSAQIDYLVITRKHIYIIECKNLIGNIEVNHAGDFIRSFEAAGEKIKKRIYSPIEQNAKHLRRIEELYEATQKNSILKQLFEGDFRDRYKPLVVLANPETILYARYAKKEIKEQIVHGDQLVSKMKELDEKTKKVMDWKEMERLAQFFLAVDQAEYSPFDKKYAALADKVKKQGNSLKMETKTEEHSTLEKQELVSELKKFRLAQSREEKIKPFYIFSDAQMEELIDKKPQTKEELKAVPGFGEKKTEKYGEAILRILQGK